MRVLSRWNTTHECERCGKGYAGRNAALIITDRGKKKIVCSNCLRILRLKQKKRLEIKGRE